MNSTLANDRRRKRGTDLRRPVRFTLVLFTNRNPAMPQCGFSRPAVQIPEFTTSHPGGLKSSDLLEDSTLRSDVKEFLYSSLSSLFACPDY